MQVFAVFAYLSALLAGVVGWVMNVVALVDMVGSSPLTAELVLRLAGVPIPFLGAVLGYV
jgi:hypothetical protein